MSDFDRDIAGAGFGRVSRADAAVIDAGLRAYMLRVYNDMVLGLAITGIAAFGIYLLSVTNDPGSAARVVRGGAEVRIAGGMYLTPIGHALFYSPLRWIVMLSPLAVVFALGFGAERLRPVTAQMLFWVYAALVGISLGVIFLVFTQTSIVRVFFITAASFGALSLWGYTTQRDLSGVGSFLIMGLFGVIIAAVVNLFLQSTTLQWVISLVGVFVFAGLTAWDTQRLKNEYLYGLDGDAADRAAIMGALSLYLNFINLFTILLQLLGQRQE
jgi:FtsH-binding integral membrane protein